MKSVIIAILLLLTIGAIAAFYPVLLYATYILSFIITFILRKYFTKLGITDKQAGLYCGFTAVLIVVLFQFIIHIWGSPNFFYQHFKMHETIISAFAWIFLIGIGFANLLMSIELTRAVDK